MRGIAKNCIGIYVRISRDDNGENFETIENQREMLLDYAAKKQLGQITAVYTDDNVSGSAFERRGLTRLKEDVLKRRIQLLLLKDLSRLGRNNAKTLQLIDFLEEYGIRILTADGRYDTLVDNDMVGIETWANERYVRDISRKIRSCLRFKIERGEYLGNAPYGYKKSSIEKNRLIKNEEQAEVVRLIYGLYRSGLGYSSVAGILNERRLLSPEGKMWNRISVRRILISRVYIGDTVQGVSEKVSFKSKKTRRLPEEEWVITEGTHEGIVSREEFLLVQKIRQSRAVGNGRHIGMSRSMYTGTCHILHDVIFCGRCGSAMYARKRAGGMAYVCGCYCRRGSSTCSSHFVYEAPIVRSICDEVVKLFRNSDFSKELLEMMQTEGLIGGNRRDDIEKISKQMETVRRQHEMIYTDRLEGRISEQLFDRMNRQYEDRIKMIESEVKRIQSRNIEDDDLEGCIEKALITVGNGQLTNELVRIMVDKIVVYDDGDRDDRDSDDPGAIIIDLRFHMWV